MAVFAQELEEGSNLQVTLVSYSEHCAYEEKNEERASSVENGSKWPFLNGVVTADRRTQPTEACKLSLLDTHGSAVLGWLMNAVKPQSIRSGRVQAQQIPELAVRSNHLSLISGTHTVEGRDPVPACTLPAVLRTWVLAHTGNKQANACSHIWGFQRQQG